METKTPLNATQRDNNTIDDLKKGEILSISEYTVAEKNRDMDWQQSKEGRNQDGANWKNGNYVDSIELSPSRSSFPRLQATVESASPTHVPHVRLFSSASSKVSR